MPSSNKILGFFGFLSEAPSAFSWCLVQRHFGSSIEARDKHGIQKCSCPEVSKSGCLSPSPKELFKNYRFPGPWAPRKIQTKQTQGGTWKSAFSQGPYGSANCQHRPDPQVLSVLGTTPRKLSEGQLVPSSLHRDFLLCDNWVILPEACSWGFHSR